MNNKDLQVFIEKTIKENDNPICQKLQFMVDFEEATLQCDFCLN